MLGGKFGSFAGEDPAQAPSDQDHPLPGSGSLTLDPVDQTLKQVSPRAQVQA